MAAPTGNQFWKARTKHGRDKILSAERARQLLKYDPISGALVWRRLAIEDCASVYEWKAKARVFGKEAGSILKNGYRSICIEGRRYYAHRLAWLITLGDWPEEDIDHVNGNRLDNSIRNLRAATRGENHQNRGGSSYTGASWHSKAGKWRATIVVGGKQKHLGYYSSQEDAASAYRDAKLSAHKFQPVLRQCGGGK